MQDLKGIIFLPKVEDTPLDQSTEIKSVTVGLCNPQVSKDDKLARFEKQNHT